MLLWLRNKVSCRISFRIVFSLGTPEVFKGTPLCIFKSDRVK